MNVKDHVYENAMIIYYHVYDYILLLFSLIILYLQERERLCL